MDPKRDADRALWVVAFVRLTHDRRSKAYLERRTSEEMSKRETLRCQKMYTTHETFQILRQTGTSTPAVSCPDVAA